MTRYGSWTACRTEWCVASRRFPASPGRVGDLIRQVVSFLASETILERRREPMYSLLCWYCTRSQQKSPEINAKSVRCDSYHDQVPEEEVPFVRREPDYKPACTLRRFMCRVFAERSSIIGKKVGKICVERAILRPAIMSRYTSEAASWSIGAQAPRTRSMRASAVSRSTEVPRQATCWSGRTRSSGAS